MNLPTRAVRLGRATWYAYLMWFALSLFAGAPGPGVIPWLASLGLLPVALVYAAIALRASPVRAVAVLLLSICQLVLGELLVGGPGTTWFIAGHSISHPPGLPRALIWPGFIVGMVLPIALAIFALASLRRGDRPSVRGHDRVGST